MPAVVEQASRLTAVAAAAAVLERYVAIVGAASDDDILSTFGWEPRLLAQALARCRVHRITIGGKPGIARDGEVEEG
jgi:hypothetical protein